MDLAHLHSVSTGLRENAELVEKVQAFLLGEAALDDHKALVAFGYVVETGLAAAGG